MVPRTRTTAAMSKYGRPTARRSSPTSGRRRLACSPMYLLSFLDAHGAVPLCNLDGHLTSTALFLFFLFLRHLLRRRTQQEIEHNNEAAHKYDPPEKHEKKSPHVHVLPVGIRRLQKDK